MGESLRRWLLQFLRVPAEPAPPPGDPRVVRTFRAAPSYFRYSVAAWALGQAGALAAILLAYFMFRFATVRVGSAVFNFGILELIALVVFIAQLPVSYALIRLNFELRWYILSDRSLRIRHGILSVHEQTMTFANIQNISIRQNPLQRVFGISSVVVRAAGGGSGTKTPGQQDSHEATFEGVDNAAQIRDVIRERIRLHRDSGLGDPDDAGDRSARAVQAAGVRTVRTLHPDEEAHPSAAHTGTAPGVSLRPALDAAHRVLTEARRLRELSQDST